MDRLTFSDIRCFRESHELRIAPITILVGENSAGKSTILSLARIAWDIAYSRAEPDFNEEPFSLGAYDDIARYHGGQGKRVTRFHVGFLLEDFRLPLEAKSQRSTVAVGALFEPKAGQPAVSAFQVATPDLRVRVQREEGRIVSYLIADEQTYKFQVREEYLSRLSLNTFALERILDTLHFPGKHVSSSQKSLFEGALPPESVLDRAQSLVGALRRQRFATGSRARVAARPYALAPIRTKPKRTYDPLKETPSPEGDHVPMLLARLHGADKDSWEELASKLQAFGRESGLFRAINVRRFQRKVGTPFQLQIKLEGQKAESNLVDVGYGVSQILPILVDCLSAKERTQFLMQQPEVHLHPRAQAELGSFVASLVKSRQHRFLIETHSDHLVDRIRLEIKNGTLSKDQVSLVYLERVGTAAELHEIELDSTGNPLATPPGYRAFFLREELRLLGLQD